MEIPWLWKTQLALLDWTIPFLLSSKNIDQNNYLANGNSLVMKDTACIIGLDHSISIVKNTQGTHKLQLQLSENM